MVREQMKKIEIIFGLSTLCLSACGTALSANDNGKTQELPMENHSVVTKKNITYDQKREQKEAYCKVLMDFLEHHLIDGEEEVLAPDCDMSENLFCIKDIDGDNSEELLIDIETTYSANMSFYVYDYDFKNHKIYMETGHYPLVTFYDNGIIEEKISHGSGYEKDVNDKLWPFRVFQYVPSSDRYIAVGDMDSIYRVSSPDDFPTQMDTNGNGIVCRTKWAESYEDEDILDKTESVIIDDQDLNDWIQGYRKNATEIKIDYQKLTQENIMELTGGNVNRVEETISLDVHQGEINYNYGENPHSNLLSEEEVHDIYSIFDGKKLYRDNPSCGFTEDVSIKFDDSQTFCFANDGCPIIYWKEKDKYFNIDEDEKSRLDIALKKFDILFPCI